MTITVALTNPSNGARQVSVATSIALQVTGTTADGYGASVNSIGVQINGTSAIYQGEFQILEQFLATDVATPTRFITLVDAPKFILGEQVQIFDSVSLEVVQTTVLSIDGNIIELNDAVNNLTTANNARIESLTRGYEGSINVAGTTIDIVINPRTVLATNSVVIVTADLISTNPFPTGADMVRGSFAFRTTDTSAPELVNFPLFINFSNLSFSVVDLLNNGIAIPSLNVLVGSTPAITNGAIASGFVGSILTTDGYASNAEIYLHPLVSFTDNEAVPVQVQVADGYGNVATYNRMVTNHSPTPRIEFLRAFPADQSVVDPLGLSFAIQLTATTLIPLEFVNLDAIIDGVTYRIIRAGKFQQCDTCSPTQFYTGTIRLGENMYVQIDDLLVATALKAYSKSVVFDFYLLEASTLGDVPPGATPLYEKIITYSTISSTIAPFVDTFLPTGNLIPASTPISFRALSKAPGVPLDLTTLVVSINSILAVNGGIFVNGFTGIVASVQGSSGNTANVAVTSPNLFTVGSVVTVEVIIADTSGNSTTSTFTFTVANTNVPTVIVTPAGGNYTTLTRLTLTSTEPAQIYYTIDGTNPGVGQLTTYVGTSPVTNVPIFLSGLTQLKAFAIGTTGVQGPQTVELYNLNPFVPQVVITSPTNGALLEQGTVVVHYTITLQQGFLAKVEAVLNNGFAVDTQNTLLNSNATLTGLLSGSNTIQIRATDNYGNVGRAQLTVLVKPSQLSEFSLSYAPLACPKFTNKTASDDRVLLNTLDTGTVAIIGLGARLEAVVDFAVGDGTDGSPVDFIPTNRPDGRHFELKAYPVQPSSLVVFLRRRNVTFPLDTTEFAVNFQSGEIVLAHPLERGESLTVQYIAEPDINAPRFFTPDQQNALFTRYGQPSEANTLSLGAQMAFENGALRVVAVQALDPLQDDGWSKSFTVLEHVEAYWITPVVNNAQLTYYPSIRLAAHTHAKKMSSVKYRSERITCGWRLGTEFDSNGKFLNEFDDERIFLIDLDQEPSVTRVEFGSVFDLNGTFVAAAIAGLGSGLAPVALPLTAKTVSGFTLSTKQRSPKLDLDSLVTQGFMPVQALSSGASIYRGRTAYVGAPSPSQEELSVERSLDYISKNLRNVLETLFVGQPITDLLLKRIVDQANEYLAAQVGAISSGKVTEIEVDAADPRQVDMKVSVVPLYPLNQFSININVQMTL